MALRIALWLVLVVPLQLGAQARGDGARTYWKKPVRTQAVSTMLQFTTGNVTGFNLEIPITGAVIESTVYMASYSLFFDMFGRNNLVSLALPAGTTRGNTTGVSPIAIDFAAKGRADPVFFWNINLTGGPALNVREFASYEQRTTLDFNAYVAAPFGEHDPDESVNIGTNRWMFRFGFPLIQKIGPWAPGRITTLEIFPSISFFTTDDGGNPDRTTIKQDPLFNLQGHLTRDLLEQLWISADALWQKGGETSEDGVKQGNEQNATSVGLTIAYQITPVFRLATSWGNSLNDDEDGMNTNTITFMFTYGWNPVAIALERQRARAASQD